MEYVVVVALAALAGLLAYRLSIFVGQRLAGDEALEAPSATDPVVTNDASVAGAEEVDRLDPTPEGRGWAPPWWRGLRRRRKAPAAFPDVPDVFAYEAAGAPPLRIPLRTRLLGLLGLIVLVVLAAAAIAVALYQAGHLIRLEFERYLQ